MDFFNDNVKKYSKWIIAICAACIIIFLALQNIGQVALFIKGVFSTVKPLILGLAIALIINVPMKFFEKHIFKSSEKKFIKRIKSPVCFIISILLIIGIIVGIIFLIVPELSHAVKVIADSIMDYAEKLKGMSLEEIEALPFGEYLLNLDYEKMIDSAQSYLKDQSGTIVNTAFDTIGSVFNGIYSFFISIVFAVYILFCKNTLKRQASRIVKAWFPKNFALWLIHAGNVASTNLRNFISGQFIEALILGSLCFIGMTILSIPYAPMVSVLVGVTALVPVVGAFIGTAVGCFLILTVNPLKALIFLIFLLILQQLEGNLIYPKVMGSRVNLPGIWILAAVTVGGSTAGTVGMLLSVPIAATAYILIKEATIEREQAIIKQA